MSTGLTWLFVVDRVAGQPDITTGPTQFNDYNECYNYGNWLLRFYIAAGYGGEITVTIYTTSPNQSGYWYSPSGDPVFVSFD